MRESYTEEEMVELNFEGPIQGQVGNAFGAVWGSNSLSTHFFLLLCQCLLRNSLYWVHGSDGLLIQGVILHFSLTSIST